MNTYHAGSNIAERYVQPNVPLRILSRTGQPYTVSKPKFIDHHTIAMTPDDTDTVQAPREMYLGFPEIYFRTNNSHVGVKDSASCSHAMFTIHNIVNQIVSGDNTNDA
jgi:hypothetical protein